MCPRPYREYDAEALVERGCQERVGRVHAAHEIMKHPRVKVQLQQHQRGANGVEEELEENMTTGTPRRNMSSTAMLSGKTGDRNSQPQVD